jgi:hypothetical protein
VYNDYRADYYPHADLPALIAAFPHGFTAQDAASRGITPDQIESWRREGYLVPHG